MLIILTTTPNQVEAELLADSLVTARLAACVQVLPPMTSVYVWEGKLQKESEHLMIIKTLPEKYEEIEAFITANHSYVTPEVVAIDAERVSGKYLDWLKSVIV